MSRVMMPRQSRHRPLSFETEIDLPKKSVWFFPVGLEVVLTVEDLEHAPVELLRNAITSTLCCEVSSLANKIVDDIVRGRNPDPHTVTLPSGRHFVPFSADPETTGKKP